MNRTKTHATTGAARRLSFLGVLLFPALAGVVRADDCGTPPTLETATVRHVIDGDTVVFTDGRHVRLIGINAMELGHAGAADQPYAAAAREALTKLLRPSAGYVQLQPGLQPYDYHGRTLAYLITPHGEDLGLQLIRAGLAVVIAEPPNIERLNCYATAEKTARTQKLAIWSRESPLVEEAATVKNPRPGVFLILTGTITSVHPTSAGIRLTLDGQIPLWIPADDYRYFSSALPGLKDHRVLVRGWLRAYKGHPEMDLRAEAVLLPLPEQR